MMVTTKATLSCRSKYGLCKPGPSYGPFLELFQITGTITLPFLISVIRGIMGSLDSLQNLEGLNGVVAFTASG